MHASQVVPQKITDYTKSSIFMHHQKKKKSFYIPIYIFFWGGGGGGGEENKQWPHSRSTPKNKPLMQKFSYISGCSMVTNLQRNMVAIINITIIFIFISLFLSFQDFDENKDFSHSDC
jgi:hypothetical protein